DRPTGCAAIMVGASGENLIAVASGANRAVAAANVPDSALGRETIVVCQMEVPAAETSALIRRACAAGARVVLNLAPAAPIDTAGAGDTFVGVLAAGLDRRLALAAALRQASAAAGLACLAHGAQAAMPDRAAIAAAAARLAG